MTENNFELREKEFLETHRQQVEETLKRVNCLQFLDQEAVDREVLLEQNTRFNTDSRKIERGMVNLLQELVRRLVPELEMTEERLTEARAAAILHDIGKSGPPEFGLDDQLNVIRMFTAEYSKKAEEVTVAEILEQIGLGGNIGLLAGLEKYGINPSKSMREFYDLHSEWTMLILEQHASSLPKPVKIIAASHHLYRGINPYQIPVKEIPAEAGLIGEMEDYLQLLEKDSLIVTDQYQAGMDRPVRQGHQTQRTHEEVMATIRVNLNPMFSKDRIMQATLDALDDLGKTGKLFL